MSKIEFGGESGSFHDAWDDSVFIGKAAAYQGITTDAVVKMLAAGNSVKFDTGWNEVIRIKSGVQKNTFIISDERSADGAGNSEADEDRGFGL